MSYFSSRIPDWEFLTKLFSYEHCTCLGGHWYNATKAESWKTSNVRRKLENTTNKKLIWFSKFRQVQTIRFPHLLYFLSYIFVSITQNKTFRIDWNQNSCSSVWLQKTSHRQTPRRAVYSTAPSSLLDPVKPEIIQNYTKLNELRLDRYTYFVGSVPHAELHFFYKGKYSTCSTTKLKSQIVSIISDIRES